MKNTIIILIVLAVAVLFFGRYFIPAPSNTESSISAETSAGY